MYISSVLSSMGAWSILQKEFPIEWEQLVEIIETTDDLYKVKRVKRISWDFSIFKPDRILAEKFKTLGWRVNNRLYFIGTNRKRYSELDAIKNGVGIEYGFGKYFLVESNVFVKIPLFIQAQRIKIGLILMFADSFSKELPIGYARFDMVKDRLLASSPIAKYPFAIIGISDVQTKLQVDELSTQLDQYLIKKTGLTLFEMSVQTETDNYDFKQELPENKKIAQEACAFANTSGGGIMLVGINKKGEPVGILQSELDNTKVRVSQVIRDNCFPPPSVDFIAFPSYPSPERCILVIEINELERKPCMLGNNVVYIRDGTSAIPAKSEHIRKMLLGSGA